MSPSGRIFRSAIAAAVAATTALLTPRLAVVPWRDGVGVGDLLFAAAAAAMRSIELDVKVREPRIALSRTWVGSQRLQTVRGREEEKEEE